MEEAKIPPGRSGTPENSRPGRYARDGNPCRIGKGAFPFRSGDRLPSRGEPDNAVSVPARELNIDAVSGRCAPAWCKNANMINSGDYFVAVM
ncbi:hypothetical protein NUBL21995_33550 [Klebsiella pneumoniae]|nr:hypothetical protein NUBL13785_22680 [Klebsiella pneumoniae]GKJ02557.1 hypothetical protein NUBL13787_41830 [Klebsiella pneumoniae]GKK05798.1 hypothetical protein NUBL13792_43650 [Klebsiella pneumoniae]GKL24355.1 hypothetical protein NUBL12144_33210 [Klebsiella pneumoniae]GKL89317.1 hypothetical protein NUBL13936_28040 [Klebsiella pneumoniae]